MYLTVKKFLLRDRRECGVRSLGAEDACAVLEQLKQASAETRFLRREPWEIVTTVEQQREQLLLMEQMEDGMLLGAFAEEVLVASCGFSPVEPYTRMRHRATLGISVLQQYWQLGIGTALLGEAVKQASRAGYEQMELNVAADNRAALRLYRKLGFVQCGRLPDAYRYSDGRYADECLMFLKCI